MKRALSLIHETESRCRAVLQQVSGFRFYALLLFLAMTVAYNAQIWRIGYYYDDWEGVFMQKQLFSTRQIWEYFLIDRPFSSLTHWIFNPILGAAPLGWRITGQLINWAAVLFLVKTLLTIWPRRVMEIGWIGLLLALYPGITRQFVVRTSMPHFTSMLLFAISLFLMVKAINGSKHRVLFTALSVGLGILQILIIEYFAGLELVRLFLLLYLARRSSPSLGQAVRKAIVWWLPYAGVFAFFLVYRLALLPAMQMEGMVMKNAPKVLNQLLSNPLAAVMQYGEIILQDVVYAVLYIWSQMIVPEELDLKAKATLLAWVLGVIVAIICAAGVELWHRKVVNEEEREPFPYLILLLCGAAILLGGLPIWIIGQQATQGIWASRFLFGIVMGAVPLVVTLVVWLAGQPRRRVQSIMLAALLAGSVSMQFRTANKYALNWKYQRDYYWQLKWRAPGLQPGTFILSPYTPFSYNADYEIAFAINMLYAPGNATTASSYWWFDGPDDLRDYESGLYLMDKPIDYPFRTIHFQSDMQHALPVHYRPARGCLQVVNPAYQLQPLLISEERELYLVQNSGLVQGQGAQVPTDVFGAEPAHGWCYTFQKADLARELKQWDAILPLWEDAAACGLKPAFAPEYLPFIEGSLHTGNAGLALQLTQDASETEDMEPTLCAVWSRIITEAPASEENAAAWDMINAQFNCSNAP